MVCIKLVCYYMKMCMCLYLTQLFSAPHLSEALLSRECVRIGLLVNAAKGRLGAPYFSWEKSEGCSVRPLLHGCSPFSRHRDLALVEQLLRAESQSLRRAKGITILTSLGGLQGGRESNGYETRGGRGVSAGCPTCSNPQWADKTKLELFSQPRTLARLSLSYFTLFINLNRRVHKGYYGVLQIHPDHKCSCNRKHLHGRRWPGGFRIPGVLV